MTTVSKACNSDNEILQLVGGSATVYGNGSTARIGIGPITAAGDPSTVYKSRGEYSWSAGRISEMIEAFAGGSISAASVAFIVCADCGVKGATQRLFLEELTSSFDTVTASSDCAILHSDSHPDAMWPGPAATTANRAQQSAASPATAATVTLDITAWAQARLAAGDYSAARFRLIAANSGFTGYDEQNTARRISFYSSKSAGNEPTMSVTGTAVSGSAKAMPETGTGFDDLAISSSSATGALTFEVDGEFGTISITQPNSEGSATLGSVSQLGVEVNFDFSLDVLPVGSLLQLSALARYISASNHYRLTLVIGPSGTVMASIEKDAAAAVTVLAQATDAGVLIELGMRYHIRFLATGSSPTVLKGKVWQDGTSEPDWQVSVSDSTAAMQVAGTVGVRAKGQSGLANLPITFSIDEFAAVTA